MTNSRSNPYWAIPLLVLLVLPGRAFAEPFVIAYNSDWPPYSIGYGDTVRGILPDLLEELIGRRMGMQVAHVGYPWKRVQEAVRNGEVDAMITFASDERKGYAHASPSIVYTLKQRPVVKKGSAVETALLHSPTPDELRKHTVCMMIGDGWSTTYYRKLEVEPITARNAQACLRMVASDRADIFLHPEAVVIAHLQAIDTLHRLTHLPTVFEKMEFSLLVSKQSPQGTEDFMNGFEQVLADPRRDQALEKLIDGYHQRKY